MKVKVGDAVLVRWQDHYSRNCGWKGISELKDTSKDNYFCYSTGVIVSLDKKQVVLAQNWHRPEKKDWEPQASDLMIIIVKCIDKITLIKKKVL